MLYSAYGVKSRSVVEIYALKMADGGFGFQRRDSQKGYPLLSTARNLTVQAFLLSWLLALFLPVDAFAAREPELSILSVDSTLEEGVYLLDIHLDVSLGRRLLNALQSGVPLVFKLEIEIYKQHRWLPNETVASLAQRYKLTYRSLAQRYVVKNLNTDSQETFVSLNDALAYLNLIENLPVIDEALVNPKRVRGKIRLRLDSSYLPLPLRVRSLTSKVWGASSRWVGWSLQ